MESASRSAFLKMLYPDGNHILLYQQVPCPSKQPAAASGLLFHILCFSLFPPSPVFLAPQRSPLATSAPRLSFHLDTFSFLPRPRQTQDCTGIVDERSQRSLPEAAKGILQRRQQRGRRSAKEGPSKKRQKTWAYARAVSRLSSLPFLLFASFAVRMPCTLIGNASDLAFALLPRLPAFPLQQKPPSIPRCSDSPNPVVDAPAQPRPSPSPASVG